MKSFIFALIATLFILLNIALFIVSNLLVEYVKINEILKNENYDTTQLEQLSNACAKELRECKSDLNTIKALVPELLIK